MQKIFLFKKCLFEYENQFAVEKKTDKKIWGQFQKYFEKFLSSPSKIASHTFSISFSFLFSTIHRILCQNKRKIFRKFDDIILAKCMKLV